MKRWVNVWIAVSIAIILFGVAWAYQPVKDPPRPLSVVIVEWRWTTADELKLLRPEIVPGARFMQLTVAVQAGKHLVIDAGWWLVSENATHKIFNPLILTASLLPDRFDLPLSLEPGMGAEGWMAFSVPNDHEPAEFRYFDNDYHVEVVIIFQ